MNGTPKVYPTPGLGLLWTICHGPHKTGQQCNQQQCEVTLELPPHLHTMHCSGINHILVKLHMLPSRACNYTGGCFPGETWVKWFKKNKKSPYTTTNISNHQPGWGFWWMTSNVERNIRAVRCKVIELVVRRSLGSEQGERRRGVLKHNSARCPPQILRNLPGFWESPSPTARTLWKECVRAGQSPCTPSGILQYSSLPIACSTTILSAWIPYPSPLLVVSQQLMVYSEFAKSRKCPHRHQIGVMKFISLTLWPLPLQYFLPSGAQGRLLY